MKQQGFSIIETVTSLAIVSIIVSSLAGTFVKMLREYSSVTAAANDALVHQRLIELGQEVIRNYDSYPFALSPRVHKSGRVTNFDGTGNQIMYGSAARKPLPISDALTTINLEISASIRISRLSVAGTSIIIEGCQRYNTRFESDRYQSYLVVGPAGIFELAPHSHTLLSAGGALPPCHTFSLSIEKSMITPTPTTYSLYLSRYLIPINDLFTFYVDSTNSLRYLSHRGRVNIENQPIAENVLPLSMTLIPSPDSRVLALEISGPRDAGSKFPLISLTNHLARSSLLTFLLNRP